MTARPSLNVLTQLIPWFGTLPDDHQKEIYHHLQANHYEEGYQFFCGTPHQHLHLVLKGRIKVSRWNSKTNRSITLLFLKQGQLLPLFELRSPHCIPLVCNNQIEAIESLHTLSAPLAKWHQWQNEMPVLRDIILDMTSDRIAELTQKLEEIILYQVPERLLHLLERDSLLREEQGYSLLEGLTQHEIAEYLGTTRVHLCRALKLLEKNQMITRNRNRITLVDHIGDNQMRMV